MRAFQIFAAMSPQQAESLFARVAENSPAIYAQAVQAASAALKSRPSYLRKQPFEKQSAAVRRALARVVANPVAEEILAIYFLESRKPLLIEWLDFIGIPHEDGTLKEDAPESPPAKKLGATVKKFRAVDDDPDRELLLHAFAAQSAIDWPSLDEQLAPPV